MNSADFLHADCEAIIFGQTDIVLYNFGFKIPVYCSCTSSTPSSSRKIVFLGLGHQVSVNFGMVLENLIKLCVLGFLGKLFCPQKLGNGPKSGPKQFFFTLNKNRSLICSIMKIYHICCVSVQIFYLGKMLFMRYRPKYSQPFRLQDF